MRPEADIQRDATAERPFSNSSEYEVWADRHCYRCVHDVPELERYCPILTVALLEGWPKEWTRRYLTFGDYVDEARTRRQPIETTADDPDGCEYVDTCTEFEERRDPDDDPPEPAPGPPPVEQCDGQLDLVDAYLDTALAELRREPAVTG